MIVSLCELSSIRGGTSKNVSITSFYCHNAQVNHSFWLSIMDLM